MAGRKIKEKRVIGEKRTDWGWGPEGGVVQEDLSIDKGHTHWCRDLMDEAEKVGRGAFPSQVHTRPPAGLPR